MTRNDRIALGLTAAVGLLVFLTRRPAAASQGGGAVPGSPPTPGPAPSEADAQALAAARGLIETARRSADALPPHGREALAQTLERAADGYAAANHRQAAEELRAAAADLRKPGTAPAAEPTLLEQFQRLRKKAEDFLNGQGSMDASSLAAMDRAADLLARAGRPEMSAALVDLASRSYERAGIRRPITMAL